MAKRKHSPVDQDGSAAKNVKHSAPPAEQRVTRSMSARKSLQAARQAVFETTELLENILVHLPPHNTLHAKEVCHRFNAVLTASSPPLRQHLFLRQSNAQPPLQYTLVGNTEDNVRLAVANGATGSRGFELYSVIERNPLLFEFDDYPRYLKAWCLLGQGYDVLKMKPHLLTRLRGRFEGSVNEPWGKMLISDPPIKNARVRFTIRLGDNIYIKGKSQPVPSATGLTMGHIPWAAFNTVAEANQKRYGLWIEWTECMHLRPLHTRQHAPVGVQLKDIVEVMEEVHRATAEWVELELILDQTFVATEEEIRTIK